MLLNYIKPLLTGFLLVISLAAQAATITVTTMDDEDADNSDCSLREAITASNSDDVYRGCSKGSGADTIRFGARGTIVLKADLPPFTAGATVLGPGISKLTIDGDEQFRIFELGF